MRRNEWTFRWRPLLMLAALGVFAHAKPGAAGTGKVDPGLQSVCRLVERAADANGLPPAFLARILWQESRFRSAATSPKGAIGVAQFMPPTAAERGLADPRQPGPAITAAAQFLADLSRRFGNLGLAAAAYNAGPGRVSKWLDGKSGLPAETRAYVAGATGLDADDWKAPAAAAHGTTAEMQGGCVAAVMLMARSPTVRVAGSHRGRTHLDRILARAAALALRAGDGGDALAAARNVAYGE